MSLSRGVDYESKAFAVGEVHAAVDAAVKAAFPTHSYQVTLYRRLADGTRTRTAAQPHDVEAICDFSVDELSIGAYIHAPDALYAEAEIVLSYHGRSFHIRAEAPAAEQLNILHKTLQDKLELTILPPPFDRAREEVDEAERRGPLWQALEDVRARLEAVENRRPASPPLTCFLSYRFGVDPAERYARTVQQFLGLLDVKVLTGEGFEPRRIEDKVRARLLQRLDFLVAIVTQGERSDWIRDEINRTQPGDVFLIPLVEEGASFTPGIFGDTEFIPFAQGHVGDALLPLLEGVVWVGRQRAADERAESTPSL